MQTVQCVPVKKKTGQENKSSEKVMSKEDAILKYKQQHQADESEDILNLENQETEKRIAITPETAKKYIWNSFKYSI